MMTKTTGTKRKQQAIETKNRILCCALELFESKGFEQVTMEEIAKKSASSIGSIYYYFNSKSGIMLYAIKDLDMQYEAFFADLMHKKCYQKLTAMDKLMAFFSHCLTLPSQSTLLCSYYIYALQHPEQGFLVMTPERKVYFIFEQLLNDCRAEGSLRISLSNHALIIMLTQIIRGILVDWILNKKNFNISAQCDKFIHLLCNGFQAV